MKKFIAIICIFFSLMIVIPICIVGNKINNNADLNIKTGNDNTFKIKDICSNEICEIDKKDFICGVVATEIPMTFEPEAIKAQAIATNTYYTREKSISSSNGTEDFDIIAKKDKIYKNYDTMKSEWGDNFDIYYQKLTQCVEAVINKIIKYNGEPILATYYTMSSGVTESSKDIFDEEKSYLINVNSPGDVLAPGYHTRVNIPADEFKEKIKGICNDITFNDDPSTWIGKSSRTQAGSIKKITICNKNFSGIQIKDCLALRSANFDITLSENLFQLDVKGCGLGVGMSQYGTQHMALQGSNYEEIISHYYPGTYIE